MSKHLTPLAVCEALIGPPQALGPLIGFNRATAFRWRHASKWRQAGDLPGAPVMRAILAYARANDIPLKPEWLIEGAPADEIEAAVAVRVAA